MKEKFSSSQGFQRLRERAKQLIRENGAGTVDIEEDDLVRLVHELEIHQVELELQNEELKQAKAEIETSREEYFDLYDSAPVAYVTLNEDNVIQRANRAAYRMFGFKRYLSGQSFLIWVHADDRHVYHSFLKELVVNKEAGPVELRLRSEGGTFHVHLLGVVKVDDKRLKHWRLALVDISERRQAEEELRQFNENLEQQVAERTALAEDRAQQLRVLMSELTLAEQRERKRLSEILHDNLQQLLVGAKINCEILLNGKVSKRQKETVENALDLVNQSIKTSRSLTIDLSPPILDQGRLSAALEWLAGWMRENHEMKIMLKADPGLDPAEEDITLLLFQSVRELLLNAVKHAGVKSARVEMSSTPENRLRVSVIDRGTGFDPDTVWEKSKAGKGFGLFSIRERLLPLDGELKIESSPGKGASFSLIVPIEPRQNRDEKRLAKIVTEHHPAKQPGEKFRILLADDHTVVRQGLSAILGLQADMEVIEEAQNGIAAVRMTRELEPDVILMDINMPKMNGLEATRIIHSEFPHIRIIGLSMYEKDNLGAAMIEAGASAYCTKDGDIQALLSAIRGVPGV